ncbi:GIY-YIG nuclease family protein [Microcoleus sp. F8-D3]
MNPTAINPLTLPSVPLANRSELPKCPAIYFVLEAQKVLYIGMTGNLQQRWCAHHRWHQLNAMDSDICIAWLHCTDISLLPELEIALIQHFQPSLNVVATSTVEETTMHVVIPLDLKREFKSACVLEGVNMSQIVCELVQDWLEKRKTSPIVENQPSKD